MAHICKFCYYSSKYVSSNCSSRLKATICTFSTVIFFRRLDHLINPKTSGYCLLQEIRHKGVRFDNGRCSNNSRPLWTSSRDREQVQAGNVVCTLHDLALMLFYNNIMIKRKTLLYCIYIFLQI